MNTLFQFLMYQIFGKYWILYDMRQGLKMALMVNEAEVAMHRAKIRTHQDTKAKLEANLADLKGVDPLEGLQEPAEHADPKAYRDAKKLRIDGHAAAIEELEGQIRGQNDSISGTDGELQRIYNILYHNKLKYDFLKTYKPKRSLSK